MDATETDDESLVGEACHIVAQKEEGPRGWGTLTEEQRDKYNNLILLCNVHHKQVDDQSGTFTVEKLHEVKEAHERWVRDCLETFDPARQRDDEIYAGYVERWAKAIELDRWSGWTSSLLRAGQPALSKERKEALDQMRAWILSRVWPHRYARLEASFENFRVVAQDLSLTFERHAQPFGDDAWITEKFYHIREWNEARYETLFMEFESHVGLLEDLALELTRAANYVCDMIREELLPSYRIQEGVALIESGPYNDLTYRTFRTEYRGEERCLRPYPGLAAFQEARFSRDVVLGKRVYVPPVEPI